MKSKRQVIITKTALGWYVQYAERSKGQRYFAAQFTLDRCDEGHEGEPRTREQIEQWVAKQPRLELIKRGPIRLRK